MARASLELHRYRAPDQKGHLSQGQWRHGSISSAATIYLLFEACSPNERLGCQFPASTASCPRPDRSRYGGLEAGMGAAGSQMFSSLHLSCLDLIRLVDLWVPPFSPEEVQVISIHASTMTSNGPAVDNAYTDLSGITATSDNPYDALIEACGNDAVSYVQCYCHFMHSLTLQRSALLAYSALHLRPLCCRTHLTLRRSFAGETRDL